MTICQLHTALAVLIRAWWQDDREASTRLVEKTARKITKQQQRKAAARKSHSKRTRRKLRELGIKLTELPRCTWET